MQKFDSSIRGRLRRACHKQTTRSLRACRYGYPCTTAYLCYRDDGMRAAARGGVVRNHFSRLAIAKRDFQQAAVSRANHPYRSLLVTHQSVRIGARRQFPLFEYLLCRIEARQPIAGHDCNIDFPVRRSRRIASEFRRRRRPFGDSAGWIGNTGLNCVIGAVGNGKQRRQKQSKNHGSHDAPPKHKAGFIVHQDDRPRSLGKEDRGQDLRFRKAQILASYLT